MQFGWTEASGAGFGGHFYRGNVQYRVFQASWVIPSYYSVYLCCSQSGDALLQEGKAKLLNWGGRRYRLGGYFQARCRRLYGHSDSGRLDGTSTFRPYRGIETATALVNFATCSLF